ncbi:MAG: hypothetical protein QXE79_03740 [Candidatus Bathyarchaeia archaeon]
MKYPERVTLREAFQVVITAEYAESLYVDICIRDVDKDEIVESLTLISNFHGPGLESYIFNLTAPVIEGMWRLEASTRAWWKNSWYGDEKQSTYRFDIYVTKDDKQPHGNALLKLTSQVQGLQFIVDRLEYESSGEELTLEMGDGLHELTVEPTIIEFENGTRLIFSMWSDGVSSNPRLIIISGKDLVLSPIYRRQYRLQVDSPLNFVRGGGWYEEGSEALIEALPEVYEGGPLYKFGGWHGDLSSMNHSLRIVADKPKRLEASWVKTAIDSSTSSEWILIISVILLTSSIINIVIIAVRRTGKSKATLAILLIAFPLQGYAITGINAMQNPTRPSYTMVGIGDSVWRYWHRTGSDTCLIWLGGGVFGERIFINPYNLESYSTMGFLQDLSNFYSIIAIEKGSTGSLQKPLNRMVYGESYKGGGFLEEARKWVENKGFKQIYIIGYSVGGIAAIEESSIHHPLDWSSPNGVILITTPIGKRVLEKASRLTGNLLILYGEHMTPLYIESGERLFKSSPPEGLHGENWIHKEFHIIPETAHEVWTIAETGKYNPNASQIIVNFIEKAKILNHISTKGSITPEIIKSKEPSMPNLTPEIIQREGLYPWCIKIDGSGLSPNLIEFAAYSDQSGIIAVSYGLIEENGLQILLNIEKEAIVRGRIRIIAFPRDSEAVNVLTYLSPPTVNITISTGFQGIPVRVDGLEYLSDSKGRVNLKLTRNHHTIKLQKSIELSNGTRLYFKGWIEDSKNETEVTINPNNIGNLTAKYVRQYLLEIDSKLGDVTERGWYDENSLIQLKVKTQIIRGEGGNFYIFDGWYPSEQLEGNEILYLNKPSKIKAVWKDIDKPPHSQPNNNYTLTWFLFLPTITLFLATILLAVKHLDHRRHLE